MTKDGSMYRSYGFLDQLQRASVSVMNNIAEGFGRVSNKDFVKFLFISRGSVGEVRSMLYLALDMAYITNEQLDDVYVLCVRESQLCWGLIKHLQKTSGWKPGIQIMLISLIPQLARF
ncbi:four helix bundle protein [Pontiella agarivorans]|uniref:Four helix bundle protein n=1 Tax=Pontiella agarivorans TaxID=3038953 RepID=A0ABU5MT05_9BACT|nr:four helix bundle protein [Pontiella agarivorans]MDZ8117335.1 four helix bundle protein [Pontiella agarivorans]